MTIDQEFFDISSVLRIVESLEDPNFDLVGPDGNPISQPGGSRRVGITFDDKELIDPVDLKASCDHYGCSTDDFWQKANGFTTRSGMRPGMGTVLMRVGDIVNDKKFDKILRVTEGNKILEVEQLGYVQAKVILGGFDTEGELLPNSIAVVTIADCRHLAHKTGIAAQFNMLTAKCELDEDTFDTLDPYTYQRILQNIWIKLDQVFNDEQLHFHEDLGTTSPAPHNVDFYGVSAWDAFFTVLDAIGWGFRLDRKGKPIVFHQGSEREDQDVINLASRVALLDMDPLTPLMVPEEITVVCTKRDYQWQNHERDYLLTGEDSFRRRPYYAKAFPATGLIPGIDPFIIAEKTRATIWASFTHITDDKNKDNEQEVDGFLEEIAKSRLWSIKNNAIRGHYLFSGAWEIIAGIETHAVTWFDHGEGLKTFAESLGVTKKFGDQMGSFDMSFSGPGQPNIVREDSPYSRHMWGVVVPSSSTALADNVEVDCTGTVEIRSGEIEDANDPVPIDEDGNPIDPETDPLFIGRRRCVKWTNRVRVQAVNTTGFPIPVDILDPVRVYCVWNYQLGQCGEWCIVVADREQIRGPAQTNTALIRIIEPVQNDDGPELGYLLDKEPPGCVYRGKRLEYRAGDDACKEDYNEVADVYAQDFRQWGPKSPISYEEIYLGIEMQAGFSSDEINEDAGTLYAIVAELPQASRIYNGSQLTIGQFQAFEVDTVEQEEVIPEHPHNYRFVASRPKEDYAHHGIAMCDIPTGKYGWGWVYGVVPALLEVTHPNHEYCDVREDNTSLVSGYEGATRIVKDRLGGEGAESGLSLVQLGILSDVTVCGRVTSTPSTPESGQPSTVTVRLEDFRRVQARVDCLRSECSITVGDDYLVMFQRTTKEWFLINGDPTITLNRPRERDCVRDNDSIETLGRDGAHISGISLGGGLAGQLLFDPQSPDVSTCKALLGTDGITVTDQDQFAEVQFPSIGLVTAVGCDGGHIFYELSDFGFVCGVLQEVTLARRVYTECCVRDCPQCPNCNVDCEDCYQVRFRQNLFPFDIMACMNDRVPIHQIPQVDGCEYRTGSLTTGCIPQACPPCMGGNPDPTPRDPDGNECFRCDGLMRDCPQDCREGIATFRSSLQCLGDVWRLVVEGGTSGLCPGISWVIVGDWIANGRCPAGTHGATLRIGSVCENGVPRAYTERLTVVIEECEG